MHSSETRYCLLTNDVETTSVYHNTLSKETGLKVWKDGMPVLLDLYAKYNIRTTFFFCMDIVQLYPDIVKMVIPFGHEVASHGFSHEVNEAFDILPYNEQVRHLSVSKKILEDLSGQEVISFRAPALRINRYTASALEEAGYRIDSSVPSQRFDFFLSFGTANKFKWIKAPRKPYRASQEDLTKKGNSGIIEIPLSACLFPYMGTTLRLMPFFSRIMRCLLDFETGITHKPMVYDIHPNEFIDEGSGPRKIARRTDNFLSYLFADLMRGYLKKKNLGPAAVPLYDEMIRFYVNSKYVFKTVKEYSADLEL